MLWLSLDNAAPLLQSHYSSFITTTGCSAPAMGNGVVADGKTFQIPQALATAEYPEQRNQQQVSGREADALPHSGIGNCLEVADQIEIGCGGGAFGHREEAIPPSSTHARSSGKKACDGL